jgi:hypothetical protein
LIHDICPSDPRLASLVGDLTDSWPDLSEAIKVGMLTTVKALLEANHR